MTREDAIDEAVRRVIGAEADTRWPDKWTDAMIKFMGPPYGYRAVFTWAPAIRAEFARIWRDVTG